MKVRISKIKGIEDLHFEIPSVGVWVLTGLNGSGKSTLLAALYRIRYSYAFQQFFKTSPLANRVDLYDEASITYEINGQSVTYRYGGQRWRASPMPTSEILDYLSFFFILYI